ncbi:MAG TPA: glutathione transferase GstA [Kofleriaceae bacterium]|nr:glutathione transferase GstA [Kofleriaceae bacterium]
MSQLTLYYTPGACSLSPHIALREADLEFQLVRVDLRAKKLVEGEHGDWLAINPKGYVPALRLADGQVLTEGAIIVQYIADQVPDAHLAPRYGTMERYRLNEVLHFIATELHKGTSPLYNVLASEDFKKQLKERIAGRFAYLAQMLSDRPYLMGDRFTIADGYAFYISRFWQHALKEDLSRWPQLVEHYQRVAARPAVAAALEVEGIKA